MTLFQRGYVWWTRLEFHGQTIVRSTECTHRGKAAAFEAQLRAQLRARHALELRRRGKRPLDRMTFGDAADRYIETVMLPKRKGGKGEVLPWVADDFHRVERLVDYFGRKADVREVARWASIAELNGYLLQKMTAESANRYLTYFRAILNKAFQWGALDQPPYVRLNRMKRYTNRYLTIGEEARLIDACDARIRDFVVFILDTGARFSEAEVLTWRHIDLDRRPRPAVTFIATKNGDSRTVPVPKRTARMLRRRHKTAGGVDSQVFSDPAAKTIYNKYGELYARRGKRIPLSNYQQLWRSVRRKIDLGDVRMHDLRHTYAAKLVRAKVPLLSVAKLLGHRTLKMTLRYAHLAIEDLDEAVALLD